MKRKAEERQAKQAEKQKKAEQKGTTGQKRIGYLLDPEIRGKD